MPSEAPGTSAAGPAARAEPGAELVRVEGLAKGFAGASEPVFDEVNFSIRRGEFVCIVGHSGCGKTTILNVLAGLERSTAGVATMEGREITGPSLDRGVVFQGHALMPWLTVRRNIGFAVRSRWPDWSRGAVDAHVEATVAAVGLGGAIDKKPAQLSGGMKQRVGIARAFAIRPKMLLLDEPFGALDALTRGSIQDELLRICAETGQTVFMITHDVDEACLLADRILLMSNGPRARVAEIVVNPLPRGRQRATLHKEPLYYPVRNHLVDFLMTRAAGLAHGRAAPFPREVRPGVDPEAIDPVPHAHRSPLSATPVHHSAGTAPATLEEPIA